MILLDTNVIIDMLNNEDDSRWYYLVHEECVICGVVIAELYSGIRNEKERNAIELFVNSVDCLTIEQNDWFQIGIYICNLKKNGLSVPFQDAVLAYLSVKHMYLNKLIPRLTYLPPKTQPQTNYRLNLV